MQSALGIVILLGLAWLLSENRKRVPWRTVLPGLALTYFLALVLTQASGVQGVLEAANGALALLEKATQSGTAFVFGYLGGGTAPFAETKPAASFILAFRALPLVLVISALSALLFHWGVLQWLVRLFAWLLRKTMGLGGAVGLSAAANVFVGMVEAPLVIKPYLARLDRGELFMVMVCGMATIAGTVLVLYASILGPVVPGALGHLLIASLVSTPAAVVVAVLMVPPGRSPDAVPQALTFVDRSAMEAVTRGTLEGLELLLNIVAMLVVFVALVSLCNAGLGLLPNVGEHPLTLERMLGWVLAPLAWTFGIPWGEAQAAGALLGKKTVLNELIAYLDLAKLPEESLSARSKLLMTYALCGFANFGSLGILLGGMGAMVPDRRGELVELGMKSIAAGLIATCVAAAAINLVV